MKQPDFFEPLDNPVAGPFFLCITLIGMAHGVIPFLITLSAIGMTLGWVWYIRKTEE